jgi:kumamolisin
MTDASSGQRQLENSERPPARGARLRGPADANETVRIVFVVRRRPGAPPLPDQAYWMATPPGRRKFLSRAQFAEQFGAAPAELDKVAKFARDQGLTVNETSVGRRSVIASGTVAIVNQVFGVALSTYEIGSDTYRGHSGRVRLPAEIADLLDGVLGLDNRRIGRRASNGPFGAVPLTPLQVAQFYQFPIGASSKNATGQTIGILEFGGGYNLGDMQTYWNSLSVTPLPKVVSIPPNVPYGGTMDMQDPADLEVMLDAEVAGAIAAGAKIVLYFGTGFTEGTPDEMGWHSLLSSAIHDDVNNPQVLSISWSDVEEAFGSSNIGMLTTVFQEAASLGVTILVSSGDYGASGYNPNDPNLDGQPHVHYPASDPWVTGCGGTYIATNPPPLSQGTWNDPYDPVNNQPFGATGGGVSVIVTTGNGYQYPWQGSANINLAGRGVPDVAGNASAYSGYDIVVYGNTLSWLNNYNSNQFNYGAIGGTSAVAPLYAGLIALINANLFPSPITAQTSVGYLNPTLYTLGAIQQSEGPPKSSDLVFWDVADGGNNTFNGVQGYTSGPGWDECTGWGSINGIQLLEMILVGYVQNNPGCMAFIMAIAQAFKKAMGGQ